MTSASAGLAGVPYIDLGTLHTGAFGVLVVIAALATFLYAPARLALDFLRPEEMDPRYLLLTFAQWGSLLVGIFSLSLLIDILIDGKPHAVAIRSRAQT